MDCLDKDVLFYTLTTMLKKAQNDKSYNFQNELKNFKNSSFFKSLHISDKDLIDYLNEAKLNL